MWKSWQNTVQKQKLEKNSCDVIVGICASFSWQLSAQPFMESHLQAAVEWPTD